MRLSQADLAAEGAGKRFTLQNKRMIITKIISFVYRNAKSAKDHTKYFGHFEAI